ncbi:rhythmically expressed gene 5 protein-like [Teleopsis dalmanni]|uniref:rhythmically expressed gene 5 protein-like n=1 Tax=Teleopsis dalmanni TaxID=139649 RepID=UPI0018CC8AD2|nr:rhythmically expressed gene 5 protein-like [Teleopsis dalmanni]
MSYLYSTFAQLVSVHCKATAVSSIEPVNQCKRNLLSYGYEKLQTFTDGQLDALDPYQRGANELIWSSIMRDHPSSTLITTRKPTVVATPPGSSLIVITHQKPVSKSSAPTSTAATNPVYQYPKNPLFDSDVEHKHKYAMDMDIAYGYPSKPVHPQVETFDVNDKRNTQQKTYLTGPLVFRVRPDGTPVEEDQYNPLPKDDDLEVLRPLNSNTNNNRLTTKHHKIATISALKEQRLANLALQKQQEQLRTRRHYKINPPVQISGNGYYYGKGQV